MPAQSQRSFSELLDTPEQADWQEFVQRKLHTPNAPWRTLDQFSSELAAEQAGVSAAADPERNRKILEELRRHAERLRQRFPS